jgi:hypothetical protein
MKSKKFEKKLSPREDYPSSRGHKGSPTGTDRELFRFRSAPSVGEIDNLNR